MKVVGFSQAPGVMWAASLVLMISDARFISSPIIANMHLILACQEGEARGHLQSDQSGIDDEPPTT
jgi:hypothetical protein